MPPGVRATSYEIPGTLVCFLARNGAAFSSSTRGAVLRYRRREGHAFRHVRELPGKEDVGGGFPRYSWAVDREGAHRLAEGEGLEGDCRYPVWEGEGKRAVAFRHPRRQEEGEDRICS